MAYVIELFLAYMPRFFRTRGSLLLENLALRQRLAALKRERLRPRRDLLDHAMALNQ